MKESDIEAHLVRKVKEFGGEVRKVKWVGRNSAPDRVVLLGLNDAADALDEIIDQARVYPHRNFNTESLVRELIGMVIVWPELKPPGGKATFPNNAHERAQHREHERMRSMGQRVEVIDSFEGVDELLR